MTRAVFEKVAASVVLVLAVAFVVAACLHTHKVYDPDTEAFGIRAFTRVGERAIAPVVTIKEGRVYEPGRGAHDWGFAPPVAAG